MAMPNRWVVRGCVVLPSRYRVLLPAGPGLSLKESRLRMDHRTPASGALHVGVGADARYLYASSVPSPSMPALAL
eukprot:5001331-Alexandrium_andersonii.AAC.1